MELVDKTDLKSVADRRRGSSPLSRTTKQLDLAHRPGFWKGRSGKL